MQISVEVVRDLQPMILKYCRGLSIPTKNSSPSFRFCHMLLRPSLYPMWKLNFDIWKDKIKHPLHYCNIVLWVSVFCIGALGISSRTWKRKGLFTPWTIKLSRGLVKFVIGCWTHPATTSIYTKEKMSKWPPNGVWGPQKTYFEAYIVHWHGPTCFAVERAKRCSNRIRQGGRAWERNVAIIYL